MYTCGIIEATKHILEIHTNKFERVKLYIIIYDTSDIYYHGVDTTSSSFKKEQCDYPDPLE